MKQYLNPFQLFSVAPHNIEAALVNIKAELTPRLAVADDAQSIVIIRGQRLSQAEWQYWFDQLADPHQREIHLYISQQKPLSNFLEYGHLGFFEAERDAKTWQNSEFVAYIRPFFIYQYAEALLQALKTQNETEMQLLQKMPFDISKEEFETYFQDISQYLDHTAADLKSLSENQSLTYLSERELVSHLPDTTINIYNHLPANLGEVRNWIGDAVGRIAMYMSVQLGRPDGAVALVRQALKLKLDETLRQELEQLLSIHKSRNRTPVWILIGVGSILLLFLLKYLETRYF